ncbi:hypothetical protein J6590_037377 [Homalodisca vitripennis]|nr:hypothetical protein J6590_037377 [Homalodisca vitripennis]
MNRGGRLAVRTLGADKAERRRITGRSKERGQLPREGPGQGDSLATLGYTQLGMEPKAVSACLPVDNMQ